MPANIIVYLILVLVALSPIPFGSARPVAASFLASMFGIILLIIAGQAYLKKEPFPVPFKKIAILVIPFGLVILWVYLQSVHIQVLDSFDHPLFLDAEKTLLVPSVHTISLDSHETRSDLMTLILYATVFWIFLQIGRDRSRAKLTYYVLAISGFTYAIYGLITQLGGFNSILWFEKWAYLDDVTGTFVNRNSFATYLGLISLCAISLFINNMSRDGYPLLKSSRENKLLYALDVGLRNWRYTLALFFIYSALLLTHSRAGLACALAGGFLLIVIQLRKTIFRGPNTLLITSAAVILMSVAASISGEITLDRMENVTGDFDDRVNIFKATIKGVKSSPWLGTGYGSFENMAPMLKSESFYSNVRFAHNTYLESIMELGFPAAILLLFSIISAVVMALRGAFTRDRDTVYPTTAFAASILVGLHSMVDFSLQIPAVAITYSAILGIGLAQSWSSKEKFVVDE